MGDLYEQDFVGWAQHQARLLRQAARERANLPLDWDNLAEEIESLGRSELNAVGSQLRRIMLHLLKLEFSSAVAPRTGWAETIADARSEIDGHLSADPGLKPRLAAMLAQEEPRAIKQAIAAMPAYHEDTTALLARQQSGAGYTLEQLLGDWLPERAGQP